MLVWANNVNELDAKAKIKGKWRVIKPGLESFMEEFNRLQQEFEDDYSSISEGLKMFVKE